jgi:hypothetical protein
MNQTLIMVVQMQLSLALFYLGYRFLLRPLTFIPTIDGIFC